MKIIHGREVIFVMSDVNFNVLRHHGHVRIGNQT